MDELLEQLRVKIESRNAKDFLQSLVDNYNGHLSGYLLNLQMMQDHGDACPHCDMPRDEFPDEIG